MGSKDIYAQEKMNIEIVCFGQIGNIIYDPPEYAYNEKRRQYLSSVILDNLSKTRDKSQKIFAIVDKDLYVPELNFV